MDPLKKVMLAIAIAAIAGGALTLPLLSGRFNSARSEVQVSAVSSALTSHFVQEGYMPVINQNVYDMNGQEIWTIIGVLEEIFDTDYIETNAKVVDVSGLQQKRFLVGRVSDQIMVTLLDKPGVIITADMNKDEVLVAIGGSGGSKVAFGNASINWSTLGVGSVTVQRTHHVSESAGTTYVAGSINSEEGIVLRVRKGTNPYYASTEKVDLKEKYKDVRYVNVGSRMSIVGVKEDAEVFK